MKKGSAPGKALPAGILVLYDEGKGLRQPSVKIFNPSPGIEQEVNDWMASQQGVVVHRVEWLPSGGLMGASVIYSVGSRAAETLRVPVPARGSTDGGVGDVELQRLGILLMLIGIILGVVALVLFTIFYPSTWYGQPDAFLDADLAVKTTVLAAGVAVLVTTLGLSFIFRGRINPG